MHRPVYELLRMSPDELLVWQGCLDLINPLPEIK